MRILISAYLFMLSGWVLAETEEWGKLQQLSPISYEVAKELAIEYKKPFDAQTIKWAVRHESYADRVTKRWREERSNKH